VGWLSADGRGITPEKILNDLSMVSGPLEVELSTMGGDFFQGIEIANIIRNYVGSKTVYLSGIVASAGTTIMLAFDKIVARDTSMVMIHNAQAGAVGDQHQMREMASRLESMSNLIAQEYAAKTGKTIAEIKALMDAETWFFGQDIVDIGLADSLETTQVSNKQSRETALMLARAQFSNHFSNRRVSNAGPDLQTISESKANAEKLIKAGKVDSTSKWTFTADDENTMLGPKGDDWQTFRLWHLVEDRAQTENTKGRFKYPYGKDGKVYRSALRSIASRAAQQGLEDLSNWASDQIKAIDAKGANVDKTEVLNFLKVNSGIPLVELAEVMGQKAQIVTENHVKALQVVDALAAEKITDPVSEIKRLRTELASVETVQVKNALDSEFGVAKTENGQDMNPLRTYADRVLMSAKPSELPAKIVEFKKDPIALRLAGENMDVNSNQNILGRVENKTSQTVNVDISKETTLVL
jgi:ATP-dependent protease ClpP protease subunit